MILFPVFFLSLFAVSILGFVFWIMKLIEVAQIPDPQFRAAGTDKVTWVIVVAILGWIGALVWHFSKRDQVLAARGATAYSAPPGWYPDPSGTMRWWDGARWTDAPPPPPPQPGP